MKFSLIPIEYRIGIGLALWLTSVAVPTWFAFGLGVDRCDAQHKREQDVADRAAQKVAKQAAEAISRIEVQRVEITQPTITRIREVPRYVDCKHDPSVLRNVNTALTGRSRSDSELPAASAADR